jgi:hypothetical protein
MKMNAEKREKAVVDRKAFKNTNGGPEVPSHLVVL